MLKVRVLMNWFRSGEGTDKMYLWKSGGMYINKMLLALAHSAAFFFFNLLLFSWPLTLRICKDRLLEIMSHGKMHWAFPQRS